MSNDDVTEPRQRGAANERHGEQGWAYFETAYFIARLQESIARLRLTVEEIEAFDEMIDVCDTRAQQSLKFLLLDEAEYWRRRADTLRNVRARIGGGE